MFGYSIISTFALTNLRQQLSAEKVRHDEEVREKDSDILRYGKKWQDADDALSKVLLGIKRLENQLSGTVSITELSKANDNLQLALNENVELQGTIGRLKEEICALHKVVDQWSQAHGEVCSSAKVSNALVLKRESEIRELESQIAACRDSYAAALETNKELALKLSKRKPQAKPAKKK